MKRRTARGLFHVPPPGSGTLHRGCLHGESHKALKALGEVTVKATKVKIYTRGDTVVYNADAFQLAEGSMLDALIRQLPGVELKDDGRILVNGRYVENLLLNGEDFFKGEPSVMLENLPAYAVKDVKVYDKDGKLSEFLGRKTGDEELVMDVRLKREYSVGWLANAEGAYGTEERYRARLFGLRFTPHTRFSAFANVNNMNENRQPGYNGEWSPAQLTGGLRSNKNFGVNYMVNEKDGKYKLNGSASYMHYDTDVRSQTTGVNFLPDGDTLLQGGTRTVLLPDVVQHFAHVPVHLGQGVPELATVVQLGQMGRPQHLPFRYVQHRPRTVRLRQPAGQPGLARSR